MVMVMVRLLFLVSAHDVVVGHVLLTGAGRVCLIQMV